MRAIFLFLGILLLAAIGWGQEAAGISPAEAREISAGVEDTLVDLNQQLADENYHTGEWNKTIYYLERVVALRPVGVEPYASAAWLLWSDNRHEEALAVYKRMIDNNPTDPQGYFEVGQYYYFNRRNYAEALKWLEKAVELGIKGRERHLYGHCLLRLNRKDEALKFWQRLLAEDPNDEVAKQQIEILTNPAAQKEEEPVAEQ